MGGLTHSHFFKFREDISKCVFFLVGVPSPPLKSRLKFLAMILLCNFARCHLLGKQREGVVGSLSVICYNSIWI